MVQSLKVRSVPCEEVEVVVEEESQQEETNNAGQKQRRLCLPNGMYIIISYTCRYSLEELRLSIFTILYMYTAVKHYIVRLRSVNRQTERGVLRTQTREEAEFSTSIEAHDG